MFWWLQAACGDPAVMVLRALRSCELLECLTNGQIVMLADLLQPRIYQDGDYIMEQGLESDEFFLVAQVGETVLAVTAWVVCRLPAAHALQSASWPFMWNQNR